MDQIQKDSFRLGQVIKINGIDLYYEHYQNYRAKQTLMFLHGFLSSSFCFRKIIPILGHDYEIFSVDLPPFGKSGKSMSFTYSYNNIAKTLLAFIETMSIKNPVLVGHSMGGQICLHMAKLSPKKFDKVILLASSGYLRRARRLPIALSYFPYFHLFVKLQLARSGVEANLRQVVHDPSLITAEMVGGYAEPFLESDEIFRGLVKLLRDREGDLTSEYLKTIQHPCLLLWGRHDKIVPLTTGIRLHQDLPCSTLEIVEGAGHLLPEEKPEETCKRIKKFLE